MSKSNLKGCKACGQQISKSAMKCPHCGDQNVSAGRVVGTVIVFLGLLWFFFGYKGVEKSVAQDAIKEYELARKGGDKVEICARASFVVVAFSQAHDEQNYLEWKEIERKDCEDAGMPKR